VLEYCNGGDLRRDMGNQPDKVYSLKETARILSDVIKGLEVVHGKGFLHRDIKIDNILVNVDAKGRKVIA
jgi:serine/threonine-protein kinase